MFLYAVLCCVSRFVGIFWRTKQCCGGHRASSHNYIVQINEHDLAKYNIAVAPKCKPISKINPFVPLWLLLFFFCSRRLRKNATIFTFGVSNFETYSEMSLTRNQFHESVIGFDGFVLVDSPFELSRLDQLIWNRFWIPYKFIAIIDCVLLLPR